MKLPNGTAFAKILAAFIFISSFGAASAGPVGSQSEIDGVTGYTTFDYTLWNNMGFEDWPSDYANLCLKHLRAVTKACANLGYDNWQVSRDFSGRLFSPSEGR
ncbi:MAG TPA: hypothetical protein VJH23_01060, partial [archaeon]|nr:hypothetical protein [archaeon]